MTYRPPDPRPSRSRVREFGGSARTCRRASRADDGLLDESHVLVRCAYAHRSGELRFVAARDAGKTVITGTRIGQIPGDGDTTTIGAAVLLVVGDIPPVGLASAMHRQPSGALDTTDVVRTVVETKARPHITFRRPTMAGWASMRRKGSQCGCGKVVCAGEIVRWPLPRRRCESPGPESGSAWRTIPSA